MKKNIDFGAIFLLLLISSGLKEIDVGGRGGRGSCLVFRRGVFRRRALNAAMTASNPISEVGIDVTEWRVFRSSRLIFFPLCWTGAL